MKSFFLKAAIVLSFVSAFPQPLFNLQPHYTVSKNPGSKFTTIQSAIDSISDTNSVLKVIKISRGIYNEKIFITKNHIALIGEDSSAVKIIYAELRQNHRKSHADDWGAAVINIGDAVHDIIFSSLSVRNNYGDLYSDRGHQFAVRGGGTRIMILDCSITSAGGDALSLWNSKSGMYYHSGCYFEGYVDFVCPRGWCFIENSRFYSRSLTAAIWTDGDMDSTQKFVLKNCRFDGISNFPLGRHHREAAFYLIGCTFSAEMKDTAIYYCGPSPERRPGRYYFYNSNCSSGCYSWLNDNLQNAGQNLTAENITAIWTFQGKWNPVLELKEFQTRR